LELRASVSRDSRVESEVADLLRLVRQRTASRLADADVGCAEAEVARDGAHDSALGWATALGQSGLQQARLFTQSAGVTGIVLTKLDGTAKGGVVVAISRELGLPVRYVGVGEKAGDLLPFDPKEFVESLFE